MKKVLALILTLLMIMSIASCAGNEQPQQSSSADSSAVDSSVQPDESMDASDSSSDIVNQPVSGDLSAAQILLADFQERAAANPDITAEEMAIGLMENEIILFGPSTNPVEPGLLNGFGNAEITGFSQGVMFGPMISVIPFVGYIFVVDEATDVEQFKANLQANANLRWNICTEADEMVVGNEGNMVFFVMSPLDLNSDEF